MTYAPERKPAVEKQGTVLLVEDDPTIQRLLQTQLTARGWKVKITSGAREALCLVADAEPDIILLDIGLADGDGLSLCRTLREWSAIPILLVTAADSHQVKVAALEMGADDYLTKPFHTGELVARMRAILRRAGASTAKSPAHLQLGPFFIHFARREARRDNVIVHLTKIEFDLLRELVLNRDRVLTYSHLLQAVWGSGYEDVRVVHVHVSHLRRKLEPDITGQRYLLTIPGVGYRFRSDDQEFA
jgi:two-component system KDP operon response regulator KdpE